MIHFSREVASCFRNNEPFERGNSQVIVKKGKTVLKLCKNVIAEKYNQESVFISNANWKSRVTKERLNTLFPGKIKIKAQGKGDGQKWFLNGVEWNGKFTQVLI
jgi:uncharacterized protein YukJ